MPAKNTFFYPKQTLNCRGKLLDLSRPAVMGVLNITPDSFFDGGKYENVEQAKRQCGKMLEEGAIIIDVGAMSSRPGSEMISSDEEIKRLEIVLPELINSFPDAIFSVDTIYGRTAEKCLKWGVHIINDISAGQIDPSILDVTGREEAPYIMMHMPGTPKSMQASPRYNNVVTEINDFFLNRIELAKQKGVKDIILDPGFGFGKSLSHNYQLLQQLDFFLHLDFPILVGVSRKSMINQVLKIEAEEALNGTSVVNTLALTNGATLLRVHDVKEAVECCKIVYAHQKPNLL